MANTTSDGSVVLSVDMNVGQAEKKLNKLTGDIEKSENKIRDITSKRDEAKEKGVLDAAALDAEKVKLQQLKDNLADLKAMAKDKGIDVNTRAEYSAEIPAAQQALAEQQERVRGLQAEYNKTENAVERYNAQLKDTNSTLEMQKTEAGSLAAQIDKANTPAAQFGQRMREAGNGVDYIQNRIKRLASRVLVFSVITMALRGMREWIGNVVKGNEEAQKSIAQLKGALLTLAQPLVNVVIPAFIKLVNVLSQIVNSIAKLVSNIFGTTAEQSAEAAKKLNDQQKALKGVGSEAKKASKQMASFDEINQVGDNNVGTGGQETTSGEIAPDFSGITSDISTQLLTDLGLLVIGALLTFSGAHILLGIGMMALGAYGLYKSATENPGAVKESLNGWIGNTVALVGIAALAIGALLTFSGVNLLLGISLMVIGAATLIAMAVLAPDKMKETLNTWIGGALIIAGIVMVVIGVVLAFSGVNILLGIGMIALGVATLYATATLAPDKMKETLDGWVGEAVVLVGIFALVIGVVLAFSGLNIPLGIGLILLGAAAMITEATLAPDSFKEMLNGWLGDVLVIVGMIALVVGVVLAFSGVNILLGIGLIALGAAALIAEAVMAPDALKEKLNGWLGAALVVGGIIAVVIGIILICTGAGLPLGIALLVLGIGMLYAGIAPNWDFIAEKVQEIWDKCKKVWNEKIVPGLKSVPNFFIKNVINKLISGVEKFINFFIDGINSLIGKLNSFGFDLPEILGGGRIGFNIPTISARVSLPRVPALAQGAVIPPNREFMAVLGDQKRGTNIETPESLLRDLYRQENAPVVELLRAILNAIRDGKELKLDRDTFAKLVYQANKQESKRVGVSFIN